MTPKSFPISHLRPQKRGVIAWDQTKAILSGRRPHHTPQKRPKFDSQQTPRKPKSNTLYDETKNIICGYRLKPQNKVLGAEMNPLEHV